MNTVIYRLPEGDLASRTQAIPQRHKIETLLFEGNTIKLDLSGVLSLSESYSDEIFGVLVVKHGQKKILSCLKVQNASPTILKSIAKVIQRRSNELKLSRPVNDDKSQFSWASC
ncbi:MAG: STAS-like domain-containing protein [Pantoea ananatis]|nr:STAS-like domain-containing protein [Pantoea ananatis]